MLVIAGVDPLNRQFQAQPSPQPGSSHKTPCPRPTPQPQPSPAQPSTAQPAVPKGKPSPRSQPSPASRLTNSKPKFKKETCQNVSVKTFRSKRFGRNVFGTQTLNSFWSQNSPQIQFRFQSQNSCPRLTPPPSPAQPISQRKTQPQIPAQPSLPAHQLKNQVQKGNLSKLSVKTFLAPKPLTISINPKPGLVYHPLGSCSSAPETANVGFFCYDRARVSARFGASPKKGSRMSLAI